MKLNYKSVSADPKKILSWFEEAIVLPGLIKNSSNYGRPEYLVLQTPEEAGQNFGNPKSGERKGRIRGYRSCPVYYLRNAGGTDGLNSYICDYDEGELNYQVLGKEANFCFTTTMNGCTFGVGSATDTGEVIVTHTNAKYSLSQQSGNPDGSQSERQRATAGQFYDSMGINATLLEPDTYRPNKEHITTFGIRHKGRWQFHYQQYTYLGGGKYRLLGVFPIATNQVQG